MKRINSSDSLGALVSMRPSTEDQNPGSSHVYGQDYTAMLEEEGCVEECGHISEKKRRLSVDQVKALEKSFEVENKLEPDRKMKLAHELGLQPRQVAVWFQNRRARWKTKQLERDYGVLKANFNALKCNYDSVKHENETLVSKIRGLKSKLQDGFSENAISVKKELILSETTGDALIEHNSIKPLRVSSPSESDQPKSDPKYDGYDGCISIFKDAGGASYSSDSSAILNNDDSNSPNGAMSSSSLLHFTAAPATNSCQLSDLKIILGDAQRAYQPQFVKIEEHNFFSGDEACNFFSDDQAPTLQWYCSDQWS